MPKKPSVGALPTPSATTAGAASQYGQTGYARNTSSQGDYGANAQASGGTGYQTGPYATGAAGGYPAASNGLASTPAAGATSPYRSPYQAAQGGTPDYNSGGAYGVADARGTTGYQGTPTTGGSNDQPWNSDAYRQAGDSYGGTQTPTSPYGGVQGASTGQQTYGNTPSTSYPTTSPSHGSSLAGGYRPGSTSRDTGALSSPAEGGGSYPTTVNASATTANQPWSYGTSGQYPTTGQY